MFALIKEKYRQNVLLRRALFGILGAIIGFCYYHFVGCSNGRCAITGNPVISTLYGAFIGLIIPGKKIEKK